MGAVLKYQASPGVYLPVPVQAGPQGLQGPAGAQGDVGVTGPKGPDGVSLPGPKGPSHPTQFRGGTVRITPIANTNTSARVNFSSPMNNVPVVVVSMRTSVPGDPYVNCGSSAEDAAGFTAYVFRTNTTDCLVDYIAAAPR